MLLQLDDTGYDNVKKLLDYASKLNLHLKLVDERSSSVALPGRALTEKELKLLIKNSRKTGAISVETAHSIVRKNFDED